jgi:GT2 family glycosyltransferase
LNFKKPFRVFSELVRMSFDSLKNEPFSRTISRIKSYVHEPYRFELLTADGRDVYESLLVRQYAQAKHDFQIEQVLDSASIQPLISVVIPVYNTPVKWLEFCVRSVLDQWYQKFELILYDDCSSDPETTSMLTKLSLLDSRITLVRGAERMQISRATNEALTHIKGEFVAFMDHDDSLEPFALMEIVRAINTHPDVEVIYSDEDKIDEKGRRFGPYFKSDFDQDLLLSNNFISHLCVIRTTTGLKVNWLTPGTDGAQDHDLLLRIIELTTNFIHVPKVLYSWRQYPGSTALSHDEKPYALQAGKEAVKNYAVRNEISAEVALGPWAGAYRLLRSPKSNKVVSIIIPFRDEPKFLRNCVDSILSKTAYNNYEILLVNNRSQLAETDSLIKSYSSNAAIQIVDHPQPFNFSEINNTAAEFAKGEFLLFLNNDTEPINPEWLTEMVAHIERAEVGVVGANLRYSDNTVQHQGVVLGIGGFAGHLFRHFPADECRHFSQGLVRQYSAVTGACLMTKKALFQSLGGFDAVNLKIALNDVDYCLKVRDHGLRVIYTPYAQLYHFESKSRGYEDTPEKLERLNREGKYLIKKWRNLIGDDPFYNPNLTLDREDLSLR